VAELISCRLPASRRAHRDRLGDGCLILAIDAFGRAEQFDLMIVENVAGNDQRAGVTCRADALAFETSTQVALDGAMAATGDPAARPRSGPAAGPQLKARWASPSLLDRRPAQIANGRLDAASAERPPSCRASVEHAPSRGLERLRQARHRRRAVRA
jgi:hypothetical protein